MTTSRVPTIPQATDALVSLLAGHVWASDTPQVAYCWPQNPENHLVLVGGGSGDEQWSAIGDLRRREDYRIDLAVLVAVPGDTALEAKQRAWSTWTDICVALREHHQLACDTGAGILWAEIGDIAWTPTVEDEGYGHVITGAVRFAATT